MLGLRVVRSLELDRELYHGVKLIKAIDPRDQLLLRFYNVTYAIRYRYVLLKLALCYHITLRYIIALAIYS